MQISDIYTAKQCIVSQNMWFEWFVVCAVLVCMIASCLTVYLSFRMAYVEYNLDARLTEFGRIQATVVDSQCAIIESYAGAIRELLNREVRRHTTTE